MLKTNQLFELSASIAIKTNNNKIIGSSNNLNSNLFKFKMTRIIRSQVLAIS